MRRLAAIALLTFAATAVAQGGATHAPGLTISFNSHPPMSPVQPHAFRRTSFVSPGFFAGFPDWGQNSVPPAAPAMIVLQMPASKPDVQTPPHIIQPLLIERRGDRFVRFGGEEKSAEARGQTSTGYVEESDVRRAAPAPVAHRELPPAWLVYRDGHREEAASYAIVSGVMYVSADYWTAGAWTKKVALADLDLPATRVINQERGVKFALPSAPNEVVTRP